MEDKSKVKETKENRHKIKRFLLLIAIILLIVHIILNLIEVTIEVNQPELITTETKVPIFDSSGSKRTCSYIPFQWNYAWDLFDSSRPQEITANFRLYNVELEDGTFYVQFGFFDESKYKFADFEDKDYEDVTDILPWSVASMHSPNQSIYLKAEDNRLYSFTVQKKDIGKTYWVYALVTPPMRRSCLEFSVIGSNETKYELKKETRLINVKREQSVTLWELFVRWVKEKIN